MRQVLFGRGPLVRGPRGLGVLRAGGHPTCSSLPSRRTYPPPRAMSRPHNRQISRSVISLMVFGPLPVLDTQPVRERGLYRQRGRHVLCYHMLLAALRRRLSRLAAKASAVPLEPRQKRRGLGRTSQGVRGPVARFCPVNFASSAWPIRPSWNVIREEGRWGCGSMRRGWSPRRSRAGSRQWVFNRAGAGPLPGSPSMSDAVGRTPGRLRPPGPRPPAKTAGLARGPVPSPHAVAMAEARRGAVTEVP